MDLALHGYYFRTKEVIGGKGLIYACTMDAVLNANSRVPKHALGLELVYVHVVPNGNPPLKDAAEYFAKFCEVMKVSCIVGLAWMWWF